MVKPLNTCNLFGSDVLVVLGGLRGSSSSRWLCKVLVRYLTRGGVGGGAPPRTEVNERHAGTEIDRGGPVLRGGAVADDDVGAEQSVGDPLLWAQPGVVGADGQVLVGAALAGVDDDEARGGGGGGAEA